MATIHKTDIDLDKNQILNARLHNTPTTIANPVVGQIIYNTTLNEPLIWNGTVWKPIFNPDLSIYQLISNIAQDLNNPNNTTYPSTQAVVDALNKVISITRSDLINLRDNSNLDIGQIYHITDRDIFLKAVSINELSESGLRKMRVVRSHFYQPFIHMTDNYLGIYGESFNRGSTPVSSGSATYYAIWGGRMWRRNTTGPDVFDGNESIIQGGWQAMDFATGHYEDKIFDVKYDIDRNHVWVQEDDRGNIIRERTQWGNGIDLTDWGNNNIYNNIAGGIYNNFRSDGNQIIADNIVVGLIATNSNTGQITENNGRHIRNNTNSSNIQHNIVRDILNNSNNGNISNNQKIITIENNSNNGNIQLNNNIVNISDNINDGLITANSDMNYLRNNSNIGNIWANTLVNGVNLEYNSNGGVIQTNRCGNHIRNNSCDGWITSNNTNGVIENNTGNLYISNNSLIGYIRNNHSISSSMVGIYNNITKGVIDNNNNMTSDITEDNPERVSRMRYNLNSPNNSTYPSTQAVYDAINQSSLTLPLILGRESINDLPQYYQSTYPDSMVQEKKNVSTVGATSLIPSGSSLSVVTYIGTSSVNVYQVATSASSGKQIKRWGNTTSNTWHPWEELIDISGKENVSNKVNNLNSPNNTTFPTTLAVQNAINSIPSQENYIVWKGRITQTGSSTFGVAQYLNPLGLNITWQSLSATQLRITGFTNIFIFNSRYEFVLNHGGLDTPSNAENVKIRRIDNITIEITTSTNFDLNTSAQPVLTIYKYP